MWLISKIAVGLCLLFVGLLVYFYYTDIDYEYEELLKSKKIPVDIIERYSGFFWLDNDGLLGASTGYGEITAKGMKEVTKVAKEHDLKTFYDIGCGSGKAMLIALLLGFDESVGVEIVKTRVDIANDMRTRLPKNLKKHMQIYSGDYYTVLPSIKTASLVFISNLLWKSHENKRLFSFLLSQLPNGSIIVCSTPPDGIIHGLKVLKTIDVPMSWYSASKCTVLLKEI